MHADDPGPRRGRPARRGDRGGRDQRYWLARRGAHVELSETLDGVERILDGKLDAVDESALRYWGSLP